MTDEERRASAPKAHVNFVRSGFLKDLRTKKFPFSHSKKVLGLIEEEKRRQKEERDSQVASKRSEKEEEERAELVEAKTGSEEIPEEKSEANEELPGEEIKRVEEKDKNEASIPKTTGESTYHEVPLRQCEKKQVSQ